VFNMVYGSGVGEPLVRYPAIRAVGYTGSINGGRTLCALPAAGPQPSPVFAAMSGTYPLVVLPEVLRRRGEKLEDAVATSKDIG
ncbi:aldehyde dehydrogenase family protein, partial [Pseudomonas aeruginosa]